MITWNIKMIIRFSYDLVKNQGQILDDLENERRNYLHDFSKCLFVMKMRNSWPTRLSNQMCKTRIYYTYKITILH